MFYCAPNGSKLALVALNQLLTSLNITFIDCQFTNHFLVDMGCVEISRDNFIQQQQKAIKVKIPDGFWSPRTLILQ